MRNSAWLIGRANANCGHILLDEDTISGNHATLNYHNGKFYLIDNNSKNGTFLIYNNETIHLNQHYEVLLNDEVYFGDKRYILDEIVASAKKNRGVETSELIILNENYNANSSLDIPMKEEKEVKEVKSNVKLGKSKKIRCLNCTSPISSDRAWPNCSSIKHLKEMNL